MRSKLSAAQLSRLITVVCLTCLISHQAQADLIGNGTNTVEALYFLGAAQSPPQGPPTEIQGAGPALIPAHFGISPIAEGHCLSAQYQHCRVSTSSPALNFSFHRA
jgi:hypothetical protein